MNKEDLKRILEEKNKKLIEDYDKQIKKLEKRIMTKEYVGIYRNWANDDIYYFQQTIKSIKDGSFDRKYLIHYDISNYFVYDIAKIKDDSTSYEDCIILKSCVVGELNKFLENIEFFDGLGDIDDVYDINKFLKDVNWIDLGMNKYYFFFGLEIIKTKIE